MGLARRIRIAVPIVLGGFLLMCGCSGRATTPASYEPFNAKDGTVQCQVPGDWKQSGGGGGRTFVSCRFKKGGAEIRILGDVVGSAIGDIAGSRDQQNPEFTAVAIAHKHSIEVTSEELGEFDVKSTQTIRTGFGDTRLSEFAYSGAFGAERHGYLATALGREKRVRVICTCPEKDWKTLKPAFDKVIGSMAVGRRES